MNSHNETAIRILGLSEQPLSYANGQVTGKASGFYNALTPPATVIDFISAQTSPKNLPLSYVLQFRPQKSIWRAAAKLNPMAFRKRSQLAEERLREFDGRYDLIFQLHTLLSPGTRFKERAYVMTTDNTYIQSQRYWPEWVPARGPGVHRRWIDMEGEVYRHARMIFSWSEFTRLSLINDYGVAPERVVAVGTGANFGANTAVLPTYASKTALFVGFDFERKGGHVLLKAWEKVHEHMPDAILRIVGTNHPLGQQTNGVEWVGRVYDSQRLEAIYRQSSVFVMPSIFEPWGLVFLEAMGLGLPCIGTDSCAMPEIIQDGLTGLLVKTGDAVALAEALIAILGDPQRAEQMGRAGQTRALQNFTWNAVGNRMMPHILAAAEA